MSPEPARGFQIRRRYRVLLAFGIPAVVAMSFGVGLPARWFGPGRPIDASERGREVAERFERLIADAQHMTWGALDAYPGAPLRPAGYRKLLRRLEGLAIVGPQGQLLAWEGVPDEADSRLSRGTFPAIRVRLDGVQTRLLVRAGPDEEGRWALASFVLDSRLEAWSFERLLPVETLRGIHLDVAFLDTLLGPDDLDALETAPAGDPQDRMVLLGAPSGEVLGLATVHPIPSRHRMARMRDDGLAWAGLTCLVLLGGLFDWRRLTREPVGPLALAGVLLFGRALLVVLRAPAVLLPRDLGGASLYGSMEAGGLVASPADLLLTSATVYLMVRGLVGWSRRARVAREAVLTTLVLATLLTGLLVFWLDRSIVHNARFSLIDGLGLRRFDGSLLLALGLVLLLVAVTELGVATWRVAWRRARWRYRQAWIALALLLVIGLSTTHLHRLQNRLGLERLSAELAPKVLEQSALRSAALSATVRRAKESFEAPDAARMPRSSREAFAAFDQWVTSDLFHDGFRSSLDLYNSNGDLVSHFGFDLPRLPEPRPESHSPAMERAGMTVKAETFNPVAAVQQKLLHVEMGVIRGDRMLGTVVGHVLDEPDNLPFLPGTRPYLAALGAGSPYRAGGVFPEGLEYVLYGARGEVRLSTLEEPPARNEALRHVRPDGTLRIRSGGVSLVGIALEEGDRLHLFFLPTRNPVTRFAAATRLVLLALLIYAAVHLVPRLFRRRGWRALIQDVRRSFYRKLLTALLIASVLPIIGLALFLGGYVERRSNSVQRESAIGYAAAAQRVVEDFEATQRDADAPVQLNDDVLYWLRGIVQQEIHVYEDGLLTATSKRELFDSGLHLPRLEGRVHRGLVEEGLPYLVLSGRLGEDRILVAYAPVRGGPSERSLVVAVPVVGGQRDVERTVDLVNEMILLATVVLVALLAAAAAPLARAVARPVRELVEATGRIASGDYATRLTARTHDEVAELVRGFNSMAGSLAAQRADLERRREYMATLLRHATTAVISTDTRGRIVTVNPAARELLSPAGVVLRVGARWLDALAGAEALGPLVRLLEQEATRSGTPREVDLVLEQEPKRLRVVQVALPGPAGSIVGELSLLDDVTDLMRSNQLEAWAEMARAIAHEIKNPLTPIQLSTEHLHRLLEDRGISSEGDIEVCLQTIYKQVRTLREIAGEFSTYAKLPSLTPEPTDPVQFMREVIAPYRVAAPAGTAVEEHYEAVGPVAIDRRVLSRAVVNLVENALQAMPRGGTLSVEVTGDDGYVVMGVRDTGDGLNREARQRLFEPYFSTKSSGTGLGLAIVLRAVEAHHGAIEVDSRPGLGTAFVIRLPRIAEGGA